MQTSAVEAKTKDIFHPELPLDRIEPSPTNPRKHLTAESIGEMADSIRQHGVAQPILVRKHPKKPGMFEIVCGERRYHGSHKANKQSIPAVERDLDDRTVAELQIIENLQREDVHELDEAQGYRELIDKHGLSVGRIAERISKSQKYVWDRLKLLGLIPPLQAIFYAGKMTAGHAILLARLPEERQTLFAKGDAAAAFAQLSVRALAKIVQEKPPPKLQPENAKVHPGNADFLTAAVQILEAAANGNKDARLALAEIMRYQGSIGGKRRLQTMTRKERQESARRARAAQNGKVQTSAVQKKGTGKR